MQIFSVFSGCTQPPPLPALPVSFPPRGESVNARWKLAPGAVKNSRRVSPVRGVRAALHSQLNSVRKEKNQMGVEVERGRETRAAGTRLGQREQPRQRLGRGGSPSGILFEYQHPIGGGKRGVRRKALFLTHRAVVLKQRCVDSPRSTKVPRGGQPSAIFPGWSRNSAGV